MLKLDAIKLDNLDRRILQALQRDAAITEAIGPDFISAFVWNKEQEWVAYQTHVGDWERERYAFVF